MKFLSTFWMILWVVLWRAQLIPDLTNGSSKTATRNNPLSPWSGLFLLYCFASQSSQVWPHLDTPCKTWSFTRLHLSPPSMYRFSMFQQQVVVTQGIWSGVASVGLMLAHEFSGNIFWVCKHLQARLGSLRRSTPACNYLLNLSYMR